MAFPSTGILDDFNRANEGPPPSASWTNDIPAVGQAGLRVLSNKCVPAAAGGNQSSWWNVSTYGPNSEVYITVATVGYFRLFIRTTSPGVPASYDGYFLECSTSESVYRFYRFDNGVLTQLGSNVAGSVSAGDSLGFEAIGDSLTAYKKSGSWASLGSRTDATYSAAGYIGLWTFGLVTELDDFGGGTIGVTPGETGTFRTDQMRSRRTSW